MASRSLSSLSRVAAPQLAKVVNVTTTVAQQQTRPLSSNGAMAVEKLRSALDEYKQKK
jgi:hypothetical protein